MQRQLSAKAGRNQSKQNTIAAGCMLLIFLLMAGGCSLVKIEEGENFSWICTVSKKTWDTYFNMATEQFRKDIIKYLNQEIQPDFINIMNYKINEDFSEAEIYVDIIITPEYYRSMNDFSAATIEIKSAGKQFRYTLFGDYNFNCKIYFSILNKNILE